MASKTKEYYASQDRDRILAAFMQQMNFEISLRNGELFEPIYLGSHRGLQEGDLVFLQSAPATEWQLSWYVCPGKHGGYVLRTVGTGLECDWSNVGFMIVNRGLVKRAEFLEGWQRQAYMKTCKALNQCDENFYRYRGIEFDGTTMKYKIGPHIFIDHDGKRKPFVVDIPDADKLTIKRAKKLLLDGGVGSKFD